MQIWCLFFYDDLRCLKRTAFDFRRGFLEQNKNRFDIKEKTLVLNVN